MAKFEEEKSFQSPDGGSLIIFFYYFFTSFNGTDCNLISRHFVSSSSSSFAKYGAGNCAAAQTLCIRARSLVGRQSYVGGDWVVRHWLEDWGHLEEGGKREGSKGWRRNYGVVTALESTALTRGLWLEGFQDSRLRCGGAICGQNETLSTTRNFTKKDGTGVERVFGQCLDKCPIFVQILSNICPSFVHVQSLSNFLVICLNFVKYLSKFPTIVTDLSILLCS